MSKDAQQVYRCPMMQGLRAWRLATSQMQVLVGSAALMFRMGELTCTVINKHH